MRNIIQKLCVMTILMSTGICVAAARRHPVDPNDVLNRWGAHVLWPTSKALHAIYKNLEHFRADRDFADYFIYQELVYNKSSSKTELVSKRVYTSIAEYKSMFSIVPDELRDCLIFLVGIRANKDDADKEFILTLCEFFESTIVGFCEGLSEHRVAQDQRQLLFGPAANLLLEFVGCIKKIKSTLPVDTVFDHQVALTVNVLMDSLIDTLWVEDEAALCCRELLAEQLGVG